MSVWSFLYHWRHGHGSSGLQRVQSEVWCMLSRLVQELLVLFPDRAMRRVFPGSEKLSCLDVLLVCAVKIVFETYGVFSQDSFDKLEMFRLHWKCDYRIIKIAWHMKWEWRFKKRRTRADSSFREEDHCLGVEESLASAIVLRSTLDSLEILFQSLSLQQSHAVFFILILTVFQALDSYYSQVIDTRWHGQALISIWKSSSIIEFITLYRDKIRILTQSSVNPHNFKLSIL